MNKFQNRQVCLPKQLHCMKPPESKVLSAEDIVLSALMSNISAFCSHTLFMGFIRFSEQTVISSLNNINRLVLKIAL